MSGKELAIIKEITIRHCDSATILNGRSNSKRFAEFISQDIYIEAYIYL